MKPKTLNLSFFWHMHQPDYRGSDGVMKMPWVFLHAIKDYYEMPWLLSRNAGLKATFNLTPTLIEQLLLYREPLKNDHFLNLWALHPSSLDDSDKKWIVKICKSTQYETMVKLSRRFDALYHQEEYTLYEFIDLEVVFILAWCSSYLRQEIPLIRELIQKGSGYTQTDKEQLLETLCRFIDTILPFYASLQDQGRITVSTTPYNHPILPLLINMENALKANPHTILPERYLSLKEDALVHVERSIALYEKIFGKKPSGFWPAEGAVDVESVAMYQQHGIEWIATDESILLNSLGKQNRSLIYKPYRFDKVTIGFRDHALSDLIGFNYRFKSGHDAADHFVHALELIQQKEQDPTVFIIVDGENAWEFYENNAHDFFTALYTRLANLPWCTTVTMDEVSKQEGMEPLKRLTPGSWIHGTFDTWSGHSEKNRAWELIYETRRDVDHYRGTISDEVRDKIQYHFLASECSDWFWWYGDDHMSGFSDEFDALFRNHLISIYRLLEMPPPTELFEPIQSHKGTATFAIKPHGPISPVIDGKTSFFFEWLGCGRIDERKLYSTMERVRGPIDVIHYGYDANAVYVAFEGNIVLLDVEETKLIITIEETDEELTIGLNGKDNTEDCMCAVDERIELSLSRSYFKTYTIIHLRFEIVRNGQIIQTLPEFGSLSIDLDEVYGRNWFV